MTVTRKTARTVPCLVWLLAVVGAAGCGGHTPEKKSTGDAPPQTQPAKSTPTSRASVEQIRKAARQRWERGGIKILSLSAKKDRDEWVVHARTREEGRDFVRVMRLDEAGKWINDGRVPAEAYHGQPSKKHDRASQIREALKKQDAGQPDFSKVKSPGLSKALKSPKGLWKFLTSPETPYTERRAAALQGRKVFPVEWLPKLMAALGELRREAGVHYWGLKAHPLDNRILLSRERRFLKSFPADRRQRLVLGHKWTVPAKAADYPLTWDEQAKAPWPWGIRQTLEDLLVWTRPHWRDKEKAKRWLAAAMQMPCSTDDEAVLFVEATDCASHFKTLEVLARWHRIALDPKFPRAATRVGWEIGEAVRLWDDPRSQTAGQVIVTDILKHSTRKEAKHRATYGLRQFREVWRNGRELRRPEPATAILTASRMALEPKNGDQWTRLYVYVFSVCEALDVSPVKLDRHMDPKSPEVAKALAKFEAWLKANEKRLKRAAEKERPELDKVRKVFKKAEQRRNR